MTRRLAGVRSGLAILLALALAGCAPGVAQEKAPGQGFPDGGIPTEVAWASDWLSGIAGEAAGVGDPIVGIRLQYDDGTWSWRVRSIAPRPSDGVAVTASVVDAMLDARTLETEAQQTVAATDAEVAPVPTSAYDAARLSGELYPGPRLIALERVLDGGVASWRATLYDTSTGEISTTILTADS